MITIIRLEQAINRCKHVQPPVDHVLGPDLRALGTIWGEMIYHRLGSLEAESLTSATRAILERWLVPVSGDEALKVGEVTAGRAMRGADNPGGECEGCQ